MKRMIRANDIELTAKQREVKNALQKHYQALFDILDDPEFAEDGELFPLINDSKIRDIIEDELLYVANIE